MKMNQEFWILWLMITLLWWPRQTTSSDIVKDGCQEKCGDVSVPYPYGIDDSNCAMDDNFLLKCNRTHSPHQLILGKNLVIVNISVEEGTMIASVPAATRCYGERGVLPGYLDPERYIRLGTDVPLRFSDTRNKLTAFGCDTLALVSDWEGNFKSACGSMCSSNDSKSMNITGDSCSGIGCCQTPLPKSLKALNYTLGSIRNHTNNIWQFNPCDYAFLADESVNISALWNDTLDPNKSVTSNVTIEWVIKEEECDKARSNASAYACGQNANCYYSENGKGYRCSCDEGFEGNPYRPLGCHDIDECKQPKKYKCDGTCKNTEGNYTCSCPLGMRGDGKLGCQGFRITTIAAIIGAVIFIVIIGVLTLIACKQRRKERNFLKNGGMVLKHQRVRIFREAELAKATKNYDSSQFLGEGGFGSVYKGVLPDHTQVAVKKPKDAEKTRMNQEFQHEIGVVSQVNHKNVVKLLGLCLETKVPMLVYEFISNGTLFHHIHDKKSNILRTWHDRLRVATEIALALDYFHSLADPPIIHGDVKSSNILLDDNGTAKVSDFGTSVLISPGQNLLVTHVQGTFGYLDPEYLMTSILTVKSDVYSFGVVLVELLTGVKPGSRMTSGKKINIIQYFVSSVENNVLSQVLGFEVADEGEMEEIEIVAELAKRCLSSSGETRPTMRDVAEELTRLKKLHQNLWAQQHSEETEHLLGDSSYSSVLDRTMVTHSDTQTSISLEIDQNYSDSI